MTRLITRRTALMTGAAASASLIAAPSLVRAQNMVEVEMLNQDPDDRSKRNVFAPRIVQIMPGDTVKFVATDRGHNAASIRGMIPEGAEEFTGRINEEIEVTPEVPGFYGYQCTPHAALGMVGLIIVEGDGMMDNYEAAQEVRQRGRARQAWDEIWAEVEEMGVV